MKKKIIALLTCLMAFIPFVSAQEIYKDAVLGYSNDVPICSYITDKVEVSVGADVKQKVYGYGKELLLYITIENKSEVPVNVGPENIKASVTNGKSLTELNVMTAKEYLEYLKKNILWFGPDNREEVKVETKVRAVEGGLETRQGVNSTTKTSVYTGAANEAYNSANEFVNENYLKKNTLSNGDVSEGIVAIRLPKKARKKPVEIKMVLGGDVYIFSFEDL